MNITFDDLLFVLNALPNPFDRMFPIKILIANPRDTIANINVNCSIPLFPL